MHTFRQVDVFASGPLTGNPVAVVHDADDLDAEQMQRFARWTNLSETTFLLRPTDPGADYRLRIFTPARELRFAGHPTLGSAHAWLEANPAPGGRPLVQECGAGLVTIGNDERLAFEAPSLVRSGPVDAADVERIAAALRTPAGAIVDTQWCDNGPGWVGVLLTDADAVLALRPDQSLFAELRIGVIGPRSGGDTDAEVRAFVPGDGISEDPVTGSLNASLGQWLAGTVLPQEYVAAQGTAIGRRGRVHVRRVGEAVWVGGDTRTTIRGEVELGH